MSNRAATSTPCVGSSARMTLTSPRRKGRVRETFCWLPPERNCTGCSIDAARMLRRRTRSSTVRRSRRRCRNPTRPRRRRTWIVVLARTLRTGKSDSPARSPLSSTTPARSASSGDRGVERATVADRRFRSRARRRRARGGTAPDRCPRRPRSRGSRPSRRRGRSARTGRRVRPETVRRTSRAVAGARADPGRRAGADARSSARRGGPPTSTPPRTSPGRRRRAGR